MELGLIPTFGITVILPKISTLLLAGVYSVTVTDSNVCTVTKSFTITQPPFPVSVNGTVADVNCNGNNNGTINVTPLNGVGPYSFYWSDSSTAQNRTNLAPGAYGLTVTDHNGCTAWSSYPVTQPNPFAIAFNDSNVSCFGGSNGIVITNASGSYQPYNYNWSNGIKTANMFGLHAGLYTLTLTDNHGCTVIASTTITEPSNLSGTDTLTNVSCNGGNNGAITLSISGATGPYAFKWNDGSLSQNRTNLTAASYSVTITDSVGCTFTSAASITQPLALSVTGTVTNVAWWW